MWGLKNELQIEGENSLLDEFRRGQVKGKKFPFRIATAGES